ncbi:MAG: discoidin domain-containing protein [Planctomycetes bacterium]|nr:discoidin domain-containing protein [Planctomycetota bacterium]
MSRFSQALVLGLVLSLTGGAWAGQAGYWKLDEGSGTVAKDSSGNGNDGALEGNPTWVDGRYGKALAFANSRVVIPASASLTADLFTRPFTFAAWINPKRTGNTWQQLFRGWRTNNASNDTLFLNNDGRLSWRGRVATVWAGGMCETTAGVVPADQWTHVAVTGDGTNFRIYVNGVLTQTSAWQTTDGANGTYYIGGNTAGSTEYYSGLEDEVRVYNQALTPAEVLTSMLEVGPEVAAAPNPADRATDVPADTVLTWKAGQFAAAHDVYLGTSFSDVNTAGRANPGSVLASRGQANTQYDPAGLLSYGQTYYWRVDEVNAPPTGTIFKGTVWSFAVEPYGYPVKPVKATAFSSQAGMGPEKTIDGSGLTGDLHGTEPTTMWLSVGVPPNWIQYEFDQVYTLHQLMVWNSNQMIESVIGFGARKVTVETSLDGAAWTAVADVPEFSRASGLPGYAANTTVNFGGVEAKFVKLTINSNWSGAVPPTGLAEVRFSYVPMRARAPQPANGATGVDLDTDLNWRPGRQAASHDVFFGPDPNALPPARTVTDHRYAPDPLNFGATYYWRVNEVNAVTYPGDLWTFTTREYAVVDDFESYTDDEGSRVYEAWIDGWTNGTGAVVGYLQAPFAERTTIHGGKQAMPFEYNNVKTPFYSEATRTLDATQDWTVGGATTLALWFRGFPLGFADKGNNAFSVASTGSDIWNNSDQFRLVYKQLNGNGSVTAKVDSLTRSDAWTKAGVMIRETLDAGSRHMTMAVTPDNSCSQQYRATTGGASASTNWTGTAVKAPYWVRVTRTGNAFKTESSPDGKTWTALGTDQTIIMASNAYIGLAVTSHNVNAYSTAEFSNVATTGGVTGAWQTASIGVTQRSNGVAPLYLTVEDKAGKKKTVVNPDAGAVTQGAWTQWQIALSDLTGINLAAVKKLTIGVGDSASPKAGAAGMLYLDDIGYGRPVP